MKYDLNPNKLSAIVAYHVVGKYKELNEELVDSVECGDYRGVEQSIRRGVNVNYLAGYPLRQAMRYRRFKIAILLIANGATTDDNPILSQFSTPKEAIKYLELMTI